MLYVKEDSITMAYRTYPYYPALRLQWHCSDTYMIVIHKQYLLICCVRDKSNNIIYNNNYCHNYCWWCRHDWCAVNTLVSGWCEIWHTLYHALLTCNPIKIRYRHWMRTEWNNTNFKNQLQGTKKFRMITNKENHLRTSCSLCRRVYRGKKMHQN